MSGIIAGIDPGLDGGIVVLARNARLLAKLVMPTLAIRGGKTSRPRFDDETGDETGRMTKTVVKRVLDLVAIRSILSREYIGVALRSRIARVFLEKQQAMTKPGVRQGTVAVFSHGRGYGQLEGLLVGMGLPYQLVHPKTWQKEMIGGETGDPKTRARMCSARLFPQIDLRATERSKTPHPGLVDAMLIAAYGQRTMGLDYEIDKELGF